ncbi:SPASM domain-containing protein [Candidatus Pelagibacter sp.]|nr:SPASM domain-containing protein [Candidatus Pelagibacter sp.]
MQKKILKSFIFFLPQKYIEKLIIKISKNEDQKLEITSTIGCTMMCSYCPQKLITDVSTKDQSQKKLNFNEFKNFVENIPNNTQINWTGYTEPLLHEDFNKFVLYLNEKKFKQAISTTMHGRSKSQDFMSNFNKFEWVNFHLPDNKYLMKLKITDDYLEKLREAIIYQVKNTKNKVTYQVIGDDFEPKVKNLLEELINLKIISRQNIKITKTINSRSDSLDLDNLNGLELRSIKNNQKDNYYYCSKKRLNQAVMLPDGSTNICCMDYSLQGIIGTLKTSNLNEIYNYDSTFRESFVKGYYPPCKNCEYYVPLTK